MSLNLNTPQIGTENSFDVIFFEKIFNFILSFLIKLKNYALKMLFKMALTCIDKKSQ